MGKRLKETPHERRLRMSSKPKKKYSTPLVIREMHLKTIMRYYYIPTRMTKIKRLTIPRVGEYVECSELSYIIGESVKRTFGKSLAVSYLITNFKRLPHNPAIPVLDIYMRENKNIGILKKIYTKTFRAALFMIAKEGEQPRCP